MKRFTQTRRQETSGSGDIARVARPLAGGIAGGIAALSLMTAGIFSACRISFFALFGVYFILLLTVEVSHFMVEHKNLKKKMLWWVSGAAVGLAVLALKFVIEEYFGVTYAGDVAVNEVIAAGALTGLGMGLFAGSLRSAAYGFFLGALGGTASLWFGREMAFMYTGLLIGAGIGIVETSIVKTISAAILCAMGGLAGATAANLAGAGDIVFVSAAGGIGLGAACTVFIGRHLARWKPSLTTILTVTAVAAAVLAILIFVLVPYGFIFATALLGASLGVNPGIKERSPRKAAYGLLLGAFGGASWIWFGQKNAPAYIGLCIGTAIGMAENSLLKAVYYASFGALGGFLGMNFAGRMNMTGPSSYLIPVGSGIGLGFAAAKFATTRIHEERLVDIFRIFSLLLLVFVTISVPPELSRMARSWVARVCQTDGDSVMYAVLTGEQREAKRMFARWVEETGGGSVTAAQRFFRSVYGEVASFAASGGASYYGRDLMKAAANGHTHIVAMLLSKKDSIANSRDEINAALIKASEKGNRDIVDLLLQNGADIGFRMCGKTALSVAAENGHAAVVSFLLEKGAAVNNEGELPLNGAARGGHQALAKTLIDQGADVNAAYLGRTALMEAAAAGRTAIVEDLLVRGSSMTATDTYGRDALMYAVENGRADVVKLLLDRRTDVNHRDLAGETPLMFAASSGQEEIAALLIAKGAEAPARNQQGTAALDIARAKGYAGIVALLEKHLPPAQTATLAVHQDTGTIKK